MPTASVGPAADSWRFRPGAQPVALEQHSVSSHPPQTRTCGSPAYGSYPVLRLVTTPPRCSGWFPQGDTDLQLQRMHELRRPLHSLSLVLVPVVDGKPVVDISVDLLEAPGRVADAKVRAPTLQDPADLLHVLA